MDSGNKKSNSENGVDFKEIEKRNIILGKSIFECSVSDCKDIGLSDNIIINSLVHRLFELLKIHSRGSKEVLINTIRYIFEYQIGNALGLEIKITNMKPKSK